MRVTVGPATPIFSVRIKRRSPAVTGATIEAGKHETLADALSEENFTTFFPDKLLLATGCQRRSKNASAGRSKNASRLTA
jgi:hypothetical protein